MTRVLVGRLFVDRAHQVNSERAEPGVAPRIDIGIVDDQAVDLGQFLR